jgi:hypothetical protein
VRLAGDTALVTGRATIEAEVNGQPRSLRLVFLNAWTKTSKGWKFIRRRSPPHSVPYHAARTRRRGDRVNGAMSASEVKQTPVDMQAPLTSVENDPERTESR